MSLSQAKAPGSEIEAFPPGHVETYSLDQIGKATFVEGSKFNNVGEPPAYKTRVSPSTGTLLYMPRCHFGQSHSI